MVIARLGLISACLAALGALSACGGPAGPATPFPSLGADAVLVTAQGSRFTTASVQVPADTAWVLAFDNLDPLPHNVLILDKDEKTVYSSTVITGPSLRMELAPALAAGTYRFTCVLHLDMKGTLTVP